MTDTAINEIHRWRSEFPVTERYIYLNHAAVAPISRSSRDAMTSLADDVMRNGMAHITEWYKVFNAARSEAAALLRTQERNIAFAKNTSEGLGWVATGFPWREGDEIVTARMEFPSNRFPWLHLADRGVRTVLVEDDHGTLPVEHLVDAMTSRTKILAISAVQYSSGFRSDLHLLGEACRARNVLFVVDGIQAVGALPLFPEETGIDVLVADAHKWILGPEGIAVAYLSDRALDTLSVAEIGWASVMDAGNFDAQEYTLHPDAQRFEPGTPTTIALFGLHAALMLANSVGIETIGSRVIKLADHVRAHAEDRGWHLYGSTIADETSEIVSFAVDADPDVLMKRAFNERVIVSSRSGRIRVSPHYYNTAAEIDDAMQLLADIL